VIVNQRFVFFFNFFSSYFNHKSIYKWNCNTYKNRKWYIYRKIRLNKSNMDYFSLARRNKHVYHSISCSSLLRTEWNFFFYSNSNSLKGFVFFLLHISPKSNIFLRWWQLIIKLSCVYIIESYLKMKIWNIFFCVLPTWDNLFVELTIYSQNKPTKKMHT
jgi:hypothetical protein